MKLKFLIQILIIFFPWFIRYRLLNLLKGFDIDKTAYIGKSIILASHLEMDQDSYIGSLTFCKSIDKLILKKRARIGTLNYITGYPGHGKQFFTHKKDRKCQLVVGNHSAITSRHYIDCTDEISIGDFTTVAGLRSQLFTHSINLKKNIQDCKPIIIGDYNFVGTNVVILPGSCLPNNSILGANAVLQTIFKEENSLYAGVPARKVKDLKKEDFKYFSRKTGFVN